MRQRVWEKTGETADHSKERVGEEKGKKKKKVNDHPELIVMEGCVCVCVSMCL